MSTGRGLAHSEVAPPAEDAVTYKFNPSPGSHHLSRRRAGLGVLGCFVDTAAGSGISGV